MQRVHSVSLFWSLMMIGLISILLSPNLTTCSTVSIKHPFLSNFLVSNFPKSLYQSYFMLGAPINENKENLKNSQSQVFIPKHCKQPGLIIETIEYSPDFLKLKFKSYLPSFLSDEYKSLCCYVVNFFKHTNYQIVHTT